MKSKRVKPNLRIKTDVDDDQVFPVAHRGYTRSPTGGFIRDTLSISPWSGDRPNSGATPREIARRGYSRSPTGGFYRDTQVVPHVSEYHAKFWKSYAEEQRRQKKKGDGMTSKSSSPASLTVKEVMDMTEEAQKRNPLTPQQRFIAHTGFSRTQYGGFFPLQAVAAPAT